MNVVRLEIGDAMPDFEESPFMICGTWEYAINNFLNVERLEVTRHNYLIVVVSS